MNNGGLLQLIFFMTINAVFLYETVVSETYAECDGIPERTFTGSSKKCSGYIFCNGEESFDGDCEDGEYFNAEDGVCDSKEFVDCKLEEASSSSSNSSTTSTTITTTTTRTTTTASSTPTSSAIFTNSTVLPVPLPASTTTAPASITAPVNTASTIASTIKANTTNSLPPSSFTNNSTEIVSTTTTTTTITSTTRPASTSTSTSPSPSLSICPHAENPLEIVFLSNTKTCSAYYVCINGTPIEMFCSRMLHFNVKTGKCDYPENVKCLSSYLQPKEQCRRHIVDYYPHTDNCNYYYLCQSGFLMLEQCPLFYGWDIEKRTCVALSKAKCFNQAAINYTLNF